MLYTWVYFPYFFQIFLMVSLNILYWDPHNFLKEVTKKKKENKKVHKKICCDPLKILKYILWPINICLKYLMAPVKTLCPPPPIYLMYSPFLLIYLIGVLSILRIPYNPVLVSWKSRFGIIELRDRFTKPSYAKWRHTSSY